VSASTGYFLPGAQLMFRVINQQAGMLLAVAASGLPMPRAQKAAGSEKTALIWHFIKHLVVRGQAIAQPPSRVESHEPKHSSCAYLALRAERGGEAPAVVAVDGGKGLGDVLLEVDDGLLEAAVRVCEAEEGVEEAVGHGGGGAGEHGLGRRALPCVSGTREMRQAVKPVRRRGGSYAEGARACGCAVGAEAEPKPNVHARQSSTNSFLRWMSIAVHAARINGGVAQRPNAAPPHRIFFRMY
jgi:hypothetical protein